MKSATVLTTALLILALRAPAQISTDGTLGPSLNLPGPNFQITPDLGQQHGGNLFHSFQNFNLQHFESATFFGPESVNIIFSRVTGGNPSNINGLIRTTIPNAEMFLLNPAGIIFGEHARLDVQGGFHASTADYLRLGEDGRFDVRNPSNSILTVAPPMAFGFLQAPSEIQVQGSELAVAPKADLSLIGGDLTLDHAQLLTSSGRINLVSVASKGEVTAKIDHLGARIPDTSSFAQLGRFAMRNSEIETSGSPSGGVSIRGGQFFMDNSLIHSHNFGDDAGKDIDIQLSDSMRMDEDASEVSNHQHLEGNLDFEESFGITSDTLSAGKAGRIAITVPRLEIHQNTIDASTRAEGEGGNIDLQTQQLYLGEGAEILNNSYSAGTGGQINIKATEQLELIDQRIFLTEEEVDRHRKTNIQINTFGQGDGGNITIDTPYLGLSGGYILSNTDNQGHGGTIMINSHFLEILNGGAITAGVLPQGTGNGGEIKLNVIDTLKLSGFRPGFIRDGSMIAHNLQSGIAPVTVGEGESGLLEISAKNLIISDYASVGSATGATGNAGSMTITVDNLYLQQGGILTNSSGAIIGGELWLATGNGGNITVTVKEDIIIEGRNSFNPSSITANTFLSGHGGSIDLQANRLILRDGGTISANSLGTGNAGNINIKANDIHLSQGGKITTAAAQAVGGNITIRLSGLLDLQESQLTTSVHGGQGDGGNITLENPRFVVLDKGQIRANADAGHGGNIHIGSKQLVKSPCSQISASSKLGVDGNVDIESPAVNLDDFLMVLPGSDDEVELQLPKGCTVEDILNPSTTFNVRTVREGRLKSPEGFME